MNLSQVLDRESIRDVVLRYARGIDRRDFELVRSCYHPDAFDDHGDSMRGDVDEFVSHAERALQRFESTMHFMGPPLIELDGDRARVETYAVAYHRIAHDDGARSDHVMGVRYVDRFERRGDDWRIAYRVLNVEWRRIDAVSESDSTSSTARSDPLGWIMTAVAS